jgi:GTPase
MAFIDEMRVGAKAGKGGNGVVRWLHLKGKDKAGPAGGNGGRGGDIILEGVRDLGILASYRFTKSFKAEDGSPGDNNNKYGKDGEALVIKVPVGTVAKDSVSGIAHEILEEGQQIVAFRGGQGGLGNAHFKGAVNQNPEQSTPGRKGEGGELHITLKLIADAGFIGFPNAGKSSLLNALTRAESKVGAYPFTTLDPHLGDFYGKILADIPGLIDGASSGRGLGSKFLRHIERTKLLVHLVSSEQDNPSEAYSAIRHELMTFNPALGEKEEIVVLSKVDMVSEEEIQEKKISLEKTSGKEVILLSVIDDTLLKKFQDMLTKKLS